MEHHSEGYIVDIPYCDYYFRELNPLYLRTLALLHGVHLSSDAPFRYLELGYGQGSSLCIHAAATEGEFWGTDFNTEQTMAAQRMAMCCTKDVHILNASFEELAEKSRHGLLPAFDIMTLHGIWSWISTENQQYIIQIIRENLKVGGLVYVGYNTMPGWASMTPLHNFLRHHNEVHANPSQDSRAKIAAAMKAFELLEKHGALYCKKHNEVQKYFKNLCKQDLSYVVHEHGNQQWSPIYFKDMAQELFGARCTFLTTANPMTRLKGSVPQELEEIIVASHDAVYKETLRDYAQDSMFRKDIFIKGYSPLSLQEHLHAVRELRFVLTCKEDKVEYQVGAPFAVIDAGTELHKAFIQYLAEAEYTPKSIQEISQSPYFAETSLENIIQIILFFLGSGALSPAQACTKEQEEDCTRLNTYICKKGAQGNPLLYLASPRTGGAIAVSHAEQLFLLAMALGHKKQNQCVTYVYKILRDKNNTIQSSQDDQSLLLEIRQWAKTFFEEQLPFLTALKIRVKA